MSFDGCALVLVVLEREEGATTMLGGWSSSVPSSNRLRAPVSMIGMFLGLFDPPHPLPAPHPSSSSPTSLPWAQGLYRSLLAPHAWLCWCSAVHMMPNPTERCQRKVN